MATVEFKKTDLEKLVGRNLKDKDYRERIPLFGCPLEKLEEEKVYFEVSPNRPDMLSLEGFSRAIRNFTSSRPKLTDYKVKRGGVEVKVDKSVKSVRPEIVCAVVRNVKITDDTITSLMQVQEKLHETMGRKRKKVAIGIHDMSKIVPPFTYKAVGPESVQFIPLDMERSLNLREILEIHPKGIAYSGVLENCVKYPVIVDSKGDVLSFPPIINGELTRVTEKTNELFIDITGTDEIAVTQALNIITTSLYDRGFEIESVKLIGGRKRITPFLERRGMKVDVGYINKLLGTDLNKTEVKRLLAKMDIKVDGNVASIPPYRADVMHQIDLAEEVAIAYGYGRFVPTVPKVPTIGQPLEMNYCYFAVKQLMVGLGFQEAVNLTLSNFEDEFDKMDLEREPVAETLNSVTPECNILRKNLLPSMLDVISKNQHYEYPQKLFELGDVVVLDGNRETGVRTVKLLACAVADTKVRYEHISSVLGALMTNIGREYNLKPVKHPSFIEGRSAEILYKNRKLGVIGEIHPKVLKNWNMSVPVAAFEINVEEMVI